MYAIVEVGGRQWKVEPGTRLDVNRLPSAVGSEHAVERVLLAHDGQQLQIGRPYLQGAQVVCEVVDHRLGPKEISYHFRRRENWRKTVGHRQPLTRLVVKDIRLASEAAPSRESAQAAVTPRAAKPRVKKAAGTRTSRKATKEKGDGA